MGHSCDFRYCVRHGCISDPFTFEMKKRVARVFSQKMLPVELHILLDRGNGNRQTGDSCLGLVFFGRFPCTQESGKARTASWIEQSWNVYKHTHSSKTLPVNSLNINSSFQNGPWLWDKNVRLDDDWYAPGHRPGRKVPRFYKIRKNHKNLLSIFTFLSPAKALMFPPTDSLRCTKRDLFIYLLCRVRGPKGGSWGNLVGAILFF